jgi:F-box interacting protein
LIEGNSFARSYYSHNNMDKRPKIMLVGKGITRGSSFSFTPCSELFQRIRSHDDTWFDTKVVCSKPCHGMNLISTELEDHLYNPCTGFCHVYHTPNYSFTPEAGHAFALGHKNVGLGFNLSMQDHVIVEMFYHIKDFESRQYFLTCKVSECSRGSMRGCFPPPLPVSDMPPAYLAGALYWMTDPRLGDSEARAVVSFDITGREFVVFPCPPCIATWNSGSTSNAFVVELEGTLCAVLADPDTEELNIWKRENGQWHSAYTVYLEGWPGYSLGANVVVPWAVDPKDGKILLNTGRKLGFYDPARRSIESLYDLDEVLRVRSTEQPSRVAVPENPHIAKLKRVLEKFCSQESLLVQHKFSDDPSPVLSGGEQCLERRDSLHTEIMPLVPMLYEESLASYSLKRRSWVLLQFR